MTVNQAIATLAIVFIAFAAIATSPFVQPLVLPAAIAGSVFAAYAIERLQIQRAHIRAMRARRLTP